MFLPPVPNVACLVFWLKDFFCGIPSCVEHNKFIAQTQEFKACNAPNGFEFFVRPPSRFLPALSEVDAEESRHRFDYWFSFLCCCPVGMGVPCEFIRICTICVKSTTPNSGVRIGMVRVTATESEGESLTNQPSPSSRLPSETDYHRFSVVFVMYHIFCASLVAVALCNDWATIKGGGSFSWELWAIWQQLCLWNLFVQNLLRCRRSWREHPEALEQSTLMKTMLYTCPVISELADTLKDWIVTGICLKAQPHDEGIFLGGIIVVLDLLTRCLFPVPPVFPCSITQTWPLFLSAFIAAPLVLLVLWIFLSYNEFLLGTLFFLPPGCCALLAPNTDVSWGLRILVGYLILWSALIELFQGSWTTRSTGAWLDMRNYLSYFLDGACLFCLSGYTILASHVAVSFNEGAFRDVRKTYRAILSLPKRKPVSLQHLFWRDWISEKASGFAIDFCSTGRLLIAWMEDLPQGLIGLALVAAHRDQVGGIGFAAVSAAIGLAKGLLIPTGQALVLADRLGRVNSFLRDRKELCKLLPPDFDVERLHELSKSLRERRQKFADMEKQVNSLESTLKDKTVQLTEERRQEMKEELENHKMLLEEMRQKAVEATTAFMAKWSIFDRTVVQQMKNLARQRFDTDSTSSLYMPVHETIDRWLDFDEEKSVDSGFFKKLQKILELLEENSTDSDKV